MARFLTNAPSAFINDIQETSSNKGKVSSVNIVTRVSFVSVSMWKNCAELNCSVTEKILTHREM